MRNNIISNNKSMLAALLLGVSAGISLASCSDETYNADPKKDWAGTTNVITPTDEKGQSTYYQPQVGKCGDPMPYFDPVSKEFRVMYLQDYGVAENGDSYHPIWCVSTKDGAKYTAMGEVLHAGAPQEQDAGVGTGSCIYNEKDHTYYLYYTGHNANCSQTEAVLRATSKDGKSFTKDPLWMLKGADYGLDKTDFRDPCLFQTEDGIWHMVISSNVRYAEFSSSDLQNWTYVKEFKMTWNRMSECPDVFKMGKFWYMVYSDQTVGGRCVKYVKGDSWEDLRDNKIDQVPSYANGQHDEGKLDSRGFFAGKTASNGADRYIWGWCPIRFGATLYEKNVNTTDNREPEWGGALVCHKLLQQEDGRLSLVEVPAIEAKYNKPVIPNVVEKTDGVTFDGKNGTIPSWGMVRFGRLGYHNHISMTIKTRNASDKFALCFVRGQHEEGKENKWFQMCFNNPCGWDAEKSKLSRVEFKLEGNRENGDYFDNFVSGALSSFVPCPVDNTYDLDIYTDNSVVVVYYNNVVCYTTRIYGIQKNGWSINAIGDNSVIEVSNLKISEF